MEINAIIVELLSRIKVLENKVAVLESRVNAAGPEQISNRPPFPAESISAKYKSLAEYLYEKWEKKISLTYPEIEQILGFPLPETAHTFPKSYRANTKTHSYASGWLAIGYKTRVDVENKTVTFERNPF